MYKSFKRIVSILLACLMIITNINIQAYADNTKVYSAASSENTSDSDSKGDSGSGSGSDSKVSEEGKSQAKHTPMNLSEQEKRTSLSLTNWWYQDKDAKQNNIEADSEENQKKITTESYDFSKLSADELSQMGFDLEFSCLKKGDEGDAEASDYLEAVFPAYFSNLQIAEDDADTTEKTYYTSEVEQQKDDSYKVKITFDTIPKSDTLTGKVHMTFSLAEAAQTGDKDTCLFVLQDEKQSVEDPVQYKMIFSKQESQKGKDGAKVSGGDTASDSDANGNKGNVSGNSANSDAENASGSNAQNSSDTTSGNASKNSKAGSSSKNSQVQNSTGGMKSSSNVVSGYFSISGKVTYDENLNGTDWKELVRPAEFEQPIKITQKYIDSEGKEQTVVYDVQSDASNRSFYLKFVHNGEGGGDFVIENVPKSVTDSKGVECQVTSYSVNVEPTLPYYKSDEAITVQIEDPSNITAAVGTLGLTLKSQTLTLKPTVVPKDSTDNPAFTMKTTFTNPELTGAQDKDRKLEFSYKPTVNQPATIQVPLGIAYEVKQEAKDGYRFDGNYTTVEKTGETESKTSESKDKASGVINQDGKTAVTISTVNYAQNVSVGFDVEWIDNNNATRPKLTGDNFILQYKTEDGEWKELKEEDYAALGIEADKAPQFDMSKAALKQYAYTGLPAVDANGKAIEYQVLVRKSPDNYVSSRKDSEGRRTFTFEEQTKFNAKIVWNDRDNKTHRPDKIDSLKLYRRTGNGNYELVYDTLPEGSVTTGSGTDSTEWSVNIDNLPRYNKNNQEYDYVLVQGSIDKDKDNNDKVTQTAVDHYKTHYDNGTGNFGNDISLCHNNGTMTEVLYKTVDFKAQKEWKDPDGTSANRPDASVTLWRYIKSEAEDLDDAYTKGVAAQVVFQTNKDGKVKENIVTRGISNEKDSEITFTQKTVTDMPADYQLPAYDDQGREYVYFVRETLSGNHESEFETQYTGADADGNTVTYKNGAPLNGIIKNTRRKKEAVAVTKLWRNPEGLGDIDGASVQLKIEASADGGMTYDDLTIYSEETGSYDELTGAEKEKAQTITDFSADTPEKEITYYVNTCNSEGKNYDMEHAKFVETVTTKDGKTYDVSIDEDGNSIIEIDGKKYVAKTTYKDTVTLGDGTKQYRYRQTNTITANRKYTLIKEWDKSIPDAEMEDITNVNFKLERRIIKEGADDSTAVTYETVKNGESDIWTVPKQDGRTWTKVLEDLPKYDPNGYEYYYRATEVGFTTTDGTELTMEEANQKYQWGATHYRTPEQTKVVNHKTGTGRGFFTISKIWQDNGENGKDKPVYVRIYKRADLKAELKKLSGETAQDTTVIDLTFLNLKYYETKLEKNGQYTAYVNYADIEEAIAGNDGEDGQSDNWTNYVILEYSVGEEEADGARPAKYTYKQLYDAANSNSVYNLSGTVENTEREYNTRTTFEETNGQVVLLTNTRTGTTSIQAQKNWKDDGNTNATRPTSVRFYLYQDGEIYKNIPEKVSVEITEDKTADETEKEAERSCTVELNHETGVITVSGKAGENTALKWHFTVKGLDRFSLAGVQHTYNLDEVPLSNSNTDADADNTDANTQTTYSYIQKKGKTTVTEDNKTQTYAFTFTNTAVGTIDHIAYKYWKDAGVGSTNRPDLYMNLYRYLKDDEKQNKNTPLNKLKSYTLYKDYKDQIWTAEPETADPDDMEHGYNWKITVKDLPEFDENGNAYGYVFAETMNNDGKTVLGTYVPSMERKSGNKRQDTYEVFTNTITGYMTIDGKKIWTGLAGYQTKEDDLPDPEITLYRTTDSTVKDLQSKTQEEIDTLIKNNTITKVDTTHLTGSEAGSKSKTKYRFPDTDVSDEEISQGLIYKVTGTDGKQVNMLPKFDKDGNRYIYLVREVISDNIEGQLYNKINENGTLVNEFRKDVNRRKITVTKKWAGRDELKDGEKKYPSVTYTLYRYEAGNEEETRQKIESHTINSAEFTGQNGEASYTFKDLLVYSPTGVQYCYYIVESGINGYSTTYTDEDGIENGTLKDTKIKAGKSADGTEKEITVTEEMLYELKKNDRIDVISLPEKWADKNATENDNIVSVGTENAYDKKGNVQISGVKKWNDYGNAEGLRPEAITVTLKRYTNNETGQNNKVDSTEVKLTVKDQKDDAEQTPYIVWNKGENAGTDDTWSYTIYNLERYAPNGMPYIYTLSETPVYGYKQADTITGQTNDSNKVNMTQLSNSFDGSYYVRKNWMDGDNKYNLRPKNITVKLQRSIDNGANWSDIEWKDSYGTYDDKTGTWSGLPSVMEVNGKKIVSITLSNKNVIKNTKNNSWEYTFTNLPMINKDKKSYTYRCVEVKIGGVSIDETTKEDGSVKYSAGSYECRYTTQDATKTVIENTLNSTSLVVTKQWEGDQNNLYLSRPKEIKFVLQKRGVRVRTGSEESGSTDNADSEASLSEDWEDVLDENGNPYTFTISPDKDGNWTKTLEDLPTTEVYVAEDGQKYTVYSLYFRAVEIHTDDTKDTDGKTVYGTGTTVSGAQNYKDTTDYTTNSKNHTYDKDAGCNKSTITNELILDIPPVSIQVTKTWRRVSGQKKTATFELQYKKVGENDWHSYGNSEAEKKKQTVSSTEAATSTVTWNNLPKYDLAGNQLTYRVIEYVIDGYKTVVSMNPDISTIDPSKSVTDYTFTNIELQNYTVKKIWKNTDYSEKTDKGYTATFKLQQKVGTNGEWSDVPETQAKPITLTSTTVNDNSKTGTWTKLPKYTVDGEEITYRAVETKINGEDVTDNTNGAYAVSYEYKGKNAEDTAKAEPSFQDTETIATNRIIYGFVNLSKTAAYLAPDVTEGGKLSGIKFDIYKVDPDTKAETKYVSDVETDYKGNLINEKRKYGKEKKYLVSGTYILKEAQTASEYSVWDKGISFTVGSGTKDTDGSLQDTGEHGTAWISTQKNTTTQGDKQLSLKVNYIAAAATEQHHFDDNCSQATNESTAVNLESRGVVTFTKTGPESGSINLTLNTHEGASGESSAYFGVYLDKECTQQVAGMIPKAKSVANAKNWTTMVLTNTAADGTTELSERKNSNNVPYLRAYNGGDTQDDYPFTLLSGTYYIKEQVAPAGYKLDTRIRKAVISKMEQTTLDQDLSNVYPKNKAVITIADSGTDAGAGSGTGSQSGTYQWSNTPNVVKLYKRDQFGRKVPLKENGHLELKVEGDGNTFPSGENTIRLYQDTELPATKTDGTTKIDYVTYDSKDGVWTVTGLLDINKTYTLSEPDASVHENYVVAKSIAFRMNADGTIQLVNSGTDTTDTVQKDNPLQANGTDYNNYYKPDDNGNIFVMRDTSRYLKDIVLEKRDSTTNQPIPNISFQLYKYSGKNATTGELTGVQSVLKKGIYLTTDQNGKIELKNLPGTVKNTITGCALKYGLDVGNYYFKEIERGASDNYRLMDDIYFTITPKADGSAEDYSDYAKVTYDTDGRSDVTTSTSDEKTVIVKNDPVTQKAKTLELTKVDSDNENSKLAGAKFTLSYQSINHGHEGSSTGGDVKLTWTCATDTDGFLYLTDEKGNFKTDSSGKKIKPDISAKGSYTLKETQAPDGYMTRTDDGTSDVVTMVTFMVNSDNQITNVTYYNGAGNLVTSPTPSVSQDTSGEHLYLHLTVKNEKTKVSIAKKNDIESNNNKKDTKTADQKSLNGEALKGAELEIYEGTLTTDNTKRVATLGNEQSEWSWTGSGDTEGTSGATLSTGTLKENTIYTLHEKKAPTGYLEADDIYFKLSGTTTKNNTIVSQLYVWNGEGKPTDVNGAGWRKTTNLNNNVLTMVDETIIAPVDLQKVLADYTDTSWSAVKDVEFTVKTDTGSGSEGAEASVTLGTAVTTADGSLVWKSITQAGYDSKLIYDAAGHRVTGTSTGTGGNTDLSSKALRIILRQNETGYVFTESYAPDHVYNDGRSYHVSITAENYKEYRTGNTTSGGTYDTDKYINLTEAENAANHQVAKLSTRNSNKKTYNSFKDVDNSYTKPDDVNKKLAVNKPYKSAITLHKYDGDEEGQKAAIPGTEFTLYRDSVASGNIYKKAYSGSEVNATGVFTTDSKGNLSIEIHEKGKYILKETKAAAGYQLDSRANTFTFTLTDKTEMNTDGTKKSYGYDETNAQKKEEDGVPNSRIMGEVHLTKKDAKTAEALNSVVYTLSRSDVPKSAPTGSNLTDYLLKDPVDVVTGKSYKAEKVKGRWQLTELDASKCKSGEIHISGLNWGTYTLTEKTEQSGYKLEKGSDGKVKNSHTFKIDGRSTANGKSDKLSFTYNDTNTKNSVTFYKTNQVDVEAEVTESDIKGLAGAVFEVHEGDVTDTCNKDTDGNPTCTKAEFYTSDTDKVTNASGKSNKVTRVTTDKNGKVTIYGLPTDTSENAQNPANPKTYHLVEVKAPKGYKLQKKPIVFTMDRQGKVQLKTADGTFTDAPAEQTSGQTTGQQGTTQHVTMQNEPIKLYIQKYGETKNVPLKGARFLLKDTCNSESGEANCDHKLANEADSETIEITADNGKIMIPIERVIGGHTYTLTETKAPDGYECTAVVTFHVKTDGTISSLSSTGGYKGYSDSTGNIGDSSDTKKVCASTDNAKTTINILNEKIRMTLTKVDASDTNTKLDGVKFTLTPYGKTSDGTNTDSAFAAGYDNTNLTYDSNTNTYTTGSDGKITFPDGLLKHDNSYLLKETATKQGYYLGKEAKDGVILKVGKDGGITIERLAAYKGKTVTENGKQVSSCPLTVIKDGTSETANAGNSSLLSKNPQSASFDLTKKVSGNMGDFNGTFQIKLKVLEPDGTEVGEKTIHLKENQVYDSVKGLTDTTEADRQAFGADAIPVGATLIITEDNDLDYTAVVKITSTDGTGEVISEEPAQKGTAKVKLNTNVKVSIELTNEKELPVDTGVDTEKMAPLAGIALLIPVMWLAYRYRKRRRGGAK